MNLKYLLCFGSFLFIFIGLRAQDQPAKHLPVKITEKPKVKKETNTLADALLLGLKTDSLEKAGLILPKKGFPMVYTLKNPFQWQKQSADSIDLYALTVAGKKILMSARIFTQPFQKNSWYEKLNTASDAKIHREIHIDTTFKVGGDLPMGSQPSNVVVKKMYGHWVNGYIETHDLPDQPFIVDVCRMDLMRKFADHNGPDFYRTHPQQIRFDTIIKVTESPECLNINNLYAHVWIPFELSKAPTDRIYVKIFVSVTGQVENLVFLRKPNPIAASALLCGLTHLRFKPAVNEKQKTPFWVTLPILLEREKKK